MSSYNENQTRGRYADSGEMHADTRGPDNVDPTHSDRQLPNLVVELVAVEGPEGQKLHAIQAEVIRRVLTRLAEQQNHTPQKESRL